jgi:fumarate hydratase class II
MNANEVIATRAQQIMSGTAVHPNDHVNMCQSSNDVIPAAIHVAAMMELQEKLLPSLQHLQNELMRKAQANHDVIKTGRTHLMKRRIAEKTARFERCRSPRISI